jgi:hypothetical protein
MTEHYVRYASLAANLQPPLTEYELVMHPKRKKKKRSVRKKKKKKGRASENWHYFTF